MLGVLEEINGKTGPTPPAMSVKGFLGLRSTSSISRDQAVKFGNDFDGLIGHKRGLQLFTDFTQKLHAAENIEFYLAVKDFQSQCDKAKTPKRGEKLPEKLQECARRIYMTFVHNQSEKQININDVIRKDIENKREMPTKKMFDEAQAQIYILMKTDIYPRFLMDDSYLNLTRTETS